MFSVAIDGPSGVGKGTICHAISKKFNLIHIESGAFYRCIALYFIENNINYNSEDIVKLHIKKIKISISQNDGDQITYLNGINVSSKLYSSHISDVCSIVSQFQCVREKVLKVQREVASNNDIIMEGRDITSNVLPNANIKIYLDASAEVRAKRREKNLKDLGEIVNYKEVYEDICERDRRDKFRKIAPLILTKGTIYIDNTEQTIKQTTKIIENIILEVKK